MKLYLIAGEKARISSWTWFIKDLVDMVVPIIPISRRYVSVHNSRATTAVEVSREDSPKEKCPS